MTRQMIAQDIYRMLPWILQGIIFAIWGALFLFIGYQWGKRRGLNEQPNTFRNELRQAQFRQEVSEAQKETAEKAVRYYKTVIDQLSKARSET